MAYPLQIPVISMGVEEYLVMLIASFAGGPFGTWLVTDLSPQFGYAPVHPGRLTSGDGDGVLVAPVRTAS